MDKTTSVRTPWRDGNWKVKDGGLDIIILAEEKLTSRGSGHSSKLKYGSFGEADPKIVELTGEKYYTLESTYDVIGKEMVDYGVLINDGTTIVFKGIMGVSTLVWITEEEAEQMANDGDPIEAPTNPYKIQPERQGRLIWITGPPGLGKSTSAQLLSREHGYVYYEGDCFFGLRNPYIPPDVENPSLAQAKQRKLVGEGDVERKKMVEGVTTQYKAMMKGDAWDSEVLDEGMREMFRDIAKERARLGGDWAIAGVLFSSKMREIARLFFSFFSLESDDWRCIWWHTVS